MNVFPSFYNEDVLILELQGEKIVFTNALLLLNSILYLIENYKFKRLVLDFKDIKEMDSSGIGLILVIGNKIGFQNLYLLNLDELSKKFILNDIINTTKILNSIKSINEIPHEN